MQASKRFYRNRNRGSRPISVVAGVASGRAIDLGATPVVHLTFADRSGENGCLNVTMTAEEARWLVTNIERHLALLAADSFGSGRYSYSDETAGA